MTRIQKNQQKEIFDSLAKTGLKKTRQREIIYKIIFTDSHHHFFIEDILKKAQKSDKNINYSTVYRTLVALSETGLISQRQFEGTKSQFEVSSLCHHDHLICTHCGAIVEFIDEQIESRQSVIAKKHRYKLTHHKMELYGLCSHCNK